MGQFKDTVASGWVHELARGEIHPDADALLQLGGSFNPQQLVEESTIDFLAELRERFGEYAKLFNSFSEAGARFQEIKIYSVSQTPADFMIFRNQVKLMISNTAHGIIQIGFAQHTRADVTVNGQGAVGGGQSAIAQPQELLAQVGPFRDVFWTFQGEKVSPEQVAKFYFAEFARSTRDSKRTKTGNQFLLDQIKALLQEKGLDL